MKKITTLWSICLIVVTMAACQKAETPVPNTPVNSSLKKTTGGGQTTATTTYSGRATGVNAIVMNTQNYVVTSTQTILAQTLALPAAGGTDQTSASQASIPGVLTAETLTASTTGVNGSTSSDASATNVTITVSGHVITVGSMQATASATCGPLMSATSQVTNLVVDGNPVVVTGAANQMIFFPAGGYIVINSQVSSKKGGSATMTVTALHMVTPNGADITIAQAVAGIKC
jgi:hypothetical protein